MKFKTGEVVVTQGINEKMFVDIEFAKFVQHSMTRHMAGDFGDVPEEDRLCNQYAVENEERIFSAYIHQTLKVKIWIITEADRSYTTVLFPSEY